MHQLWTTHAWEQASTEEVIATLFDTPSYLDPRDMNRIDRYHPQAKGFFLNLFYKGQIPPSIKKLHKL